MTVERGGVLLRRVVHAQRARCRSSRSRSRAEYFPERVRRRSPRAGPHRARRPRRAPTSAGPTSASATPSSAVNPDTHRLAVTVAPAEAGVPPRRGDRRRPRGHRPRRQAGARARSPSTPSTRACSCSPATRRPTRCPRSRGARARRLHASRAARTSRTILAAHRRARAQPRLRVPGRATATRATPGGGGGEQRDARRLQAPPRTSRPGKVTADEGKAHFHFKLPDNLTTFRLMAVAAATTTASAPGRRGSPPARS